MLHAGDYAYLYRLTAGVTPLKEDCGTLCSSICCQPGPNNALGIYLFPGEEYMFKGTEDWLSWEQCSRDEHLFPPSWPETVYFIKCTSFCPREYRPLACRFFPLAPHVTRQNRLVLVYETIDLPYTCPLIKNKIQLQQEFIETTAQCWQFMMRDYRIEELVIEDSRERELDNCEMEIIWP